MRTHRAAMWSAAALALGVTSARAQAPETVRTGAESAWAQAGLAAPAFKLDIEALKKRRAERERLRRPKRKLFRKPTISPIAPRAAGPLLGSLRLADQLDRHRTMIQRQFGALAWFMSMASDSEFKVQYLTFLRAPTLVLKRIDDLNRLRGDGVVVQIDPQTQYRVKVSINIFSPVRGSTVNLDPVNGTKGPAHKMKTGEVLDAVKANCYVFKANGKELWLAYGTDVDPKTDQLAATRSLLFVHEAGMSSKAWPVPESQLAVDQATAVDLEDTKLTLIRASDGTLKIHAR